MAAPARTEVQREKDLVKIARLYLRGITQHEIAKKLKVTQQTISNDIQELIKRWRASQLKNISQQRILEIQKMNGVEEEAYKAWKRSIGKSVTKTTKTVATSAEEYEETGIKEIINESIKEEMLVGNPKFLEIIVKCSERRCKILGIDKEQGQEPDYGLLKELVDVLKPNPDELFTPEKQ